MSSNGFLVTLLSRVLKRPVSLDPRISKRTLFHRASMAGLGLLRGLILTRKRIVLGRGTWVLESSKLHLGGGLVRIEENCRIDCAATDGVHLGRNFKLGAYSRIIASGSLGDLGIGLRIGDNVGIGEFAYLGGAGGVDIGAGTIVGQYFSVHPENHVFADPDLPVREQGVTRDGIKIGSGCWIGAKVTITDGVTIGKNSVIAAGAVVTTSFPEASVIGGVPARLLRARKPNEFTQNV